MECGLILTVFNADRGNRKVCRNCRCGKENHLVVEATAGNDDPSDVRAGRLFVAPSPVSRESNSVRVSGEPTDWSGQILVGRQNGTSVC